MTRAFPLQIPLDLAERQAESKSRLVKRAYVGWLNARTQIVRLQQRRAHHVEALGGIMLAGCSTDVAQQAAAATRAWQTEFAAAAEMEQIAKQEWQRALTVWQHESKRVQALKALAARHQQAENLLEEKRERRLHDELSQNSAYAWQIAGGGGTGFIFPEQMAVDAEWTTR